MVQTVRGMRVLLPDETRRWQHVEATVRGVLARYAYEEVRLPLIEFTELFSRGVGEATDIIEKEMYAFRDRDGDSIALRPEGTAGCVRALNEAGLLFNQTQRVWYEGPMFRYERPQRGRYRQFSQIGAEAFGFAGPDVDAELILIARDCWRALGVEGLVTLELNTLGSRESRLAYRAALVEYLAPFEAELDEDSRRRLGTNPLRILDSKEAATQDILTDAPRLPDYVDAEARAHFDALQQLLDDAGVPYVLNAGLVRGLDYYTHTVFEWTTPHIGSQAAICAGGRYDGLVETLGGRPTPAAGFGLGIDRAVLLHEFADADWSRPGTHVYVCVQDARLAAYAQSVAAAVREALPELGVRVHMGGGKLKNQFKRADASGASWAVVIGEQEAEAGRVALKALRDASVGQLDLNVEQLVEQLREE